MDKTTRTKTQHTPGPQILSWYITANGDDTRFTLEDAEGSVYMRGHFGGVDYPIAPTVNLIDAAPELLLACKEALSAIEWSNADRFLTDEEVSARRMLKAAIAKAEGGK